MTKQPFRQQYWRYLLATFLVVCALIALRPLVSFLPVATVVNIVPTATPYPLNTVEPPQRFDYESVDTSLQTFDLANLPVRRDDAIRPNMNPQTFQGKLPQHAPFERYIVRRGDTPISIAKRFGLMPESLLGGNPKLSEEAGLLYADSELLILPIDGVLHDVQYGETVDILSAKYGIDKQKIIDYAPNNLEFPYRLYPKTQLIIPDAVREVFKWDPPDVSYSSYYQDPSDQIVVGTGSFIWPTTGFRITQTYWYGHQAVDVGVEIGTPLYASDSGKVTFASWSPYCYANLIVINHRNGFETFYAHLSTINVVPGQVVFQGNLIGYSGNTGCSTGPHLHFEIRRNGVRLNPCAWTSGC